MKNYSDIILYLEISGKKSHNYLGLAKAFAKQGMTLVPVNWEQMFQFNKLNKGSKTPVIIFTDGMQSKNWFTTTRKNILRRMVTSDNFSLFHFTSFPQLNFFNHSKIKNYLKVDLPISHKKIVEILALTISGNEFSYLEIR